MSHLLTPLTAFFLFFLSSNCFADSKIISAADELSGKVFCGYQGWYRTPQDGTGMRWSHYETYKREFYPGKAGIDFWPDMSEMEPDEHYRTNFRNRDGSPATVFSSAHPKTVNRHFKWMKDYGIDGIFLQRFVVGVTGKKTNSTLKRSIDRVLENCQKGAKNHQRSYALMYDLSGSSPKQVAQVLQDWKALDQTYGLSKDPNYIRHNGKPLISIWGVGFNDGRKYNTQNVKKLIDAFRAEDTEYSILLGIPTYWRNGNRDSVPKEVLHPVLKMADVILPWKVNRDSFKTPKAAKASIDTLLRPDIEWCTNNNLAYLPVSFPGFSWANRKDKPEAFNETPRLGGKLLWSQAISIKQAGANSIYVAMFDEMDEGTQIFKVTNRPPNGKTKFLTHKNNLPSDHYLKLTGAIGELMAGNIPAIFKMPNLTVE